MTVYLDYNATTPLDDAVRSAMLPYLAERFGNPSSVHRPGRQARAAIDAAREQVAALVNAHPSQVIFTSGGTEANNLAIKGIANLRPGCRIAVSAIEHSSVLRAAQSLGPRVSDVESIAVDRDGRVTPATLARALKAQPTLVSIMWANNETGVLQDIPTLTATARRHGALVHTDAVQAAGKVAVDFPASGVHLMSLSAHKLYGPKGTGALIIDRALEMEPLLHGGGHEMGYRSGTENVAGVVGFGAAAELARVELSARQEHQRQLRDYLEKRLGGIAGVVILAAGAPRVSNTVAMALPGIAGETMLMYLDEQGIAASSGSACSSARAATSHVLRAMQLDDACAESSLRISIGKYTTRADIDRFIAALTVLAEQRRQFSAIQAG